MANSTPTLLSAPAVDPGALRALSRTALVTAVLCGLAVLWLLVVNWQSRADDPLNSPRLAALKQQLLQEPKNETLKNEIRRLDLELRRRHFQQQAIHRFGTVFLVSAMVVLVLAARAAAALRVALPAPQKLPDAAERAEARRQRARQVAIAVGLALAVVGLTLAWPANSRLPSQPEKLDRLLAQLRGDGGDDSGLPSAAEFAANWPRFLGPTGNAWVTNGNLALSFDLAAGAGIRWKTPVPAPGFNSPIVWSNRVFLSGGDATNRAVFCFDLATGAPVWQRAVANIPGSPSVVPEVPESTGYAAASLATDGRRVYVIFANGDLAAFTLEGAPAWAKHLGVPHNAYGHASSLATAQGRLIVQLDQGEAEDNLSKLIAFEGATGKVAWQSSRPVGASWASPAIGEAAGKTQIVILGGEWVMAYDARNGAELWRAELITGEITPSPIFAGGLVLVPSPADTLYAVRPDGTGDVAKTHVAWKTEENIPDITSPVSNGDLIFTALSYGVITGYELKDGRKLWEHEIESEVNASPAIVGDRLYVFGAKGAVAVLKAGREAKELARFELGEPVHASPAFAGGAMVVRTAQTLFCVGEPGGAIPEAKRP